MTPGIERIHAERQKQIAKGLTAENDAANADPVDMARGAIAFAQYALSRLKNDTHLNAFSLNLAHVWPTSWRAEKFNPHGVDDALVSAGALIAALLEAREVKAFPIGTKAFESGGGHWEKIGPDEWQWSGHTVEVPGGAVDLHYQFPGEKK